MRCEVWSAQWEGALGQWLRGQLDARGIDAPAYGRYVLSLLTGPLQPADLSPETVQGAKWWDRKNSTWTPVRIEALKKSAAVQCLIDASDDQSSGIEELVEELYLRIKEVEEKRCGKKGTQGGRTGKRERTRTASPREMARLYYAAFPALGGGNNGAADVVPKPCQQWPPKRRHRGPRSPRPPHAPPMPLPEWITHEDAWDMDANDPIREFIKSIAVDEGYGTCENTIADDFSNSKRLYERDSANSSLRGDGDDIVFSRDWVITDDFGSTIKSPAEEESIAKFEAKFDRSIEALWPKEQAKYESENDCQDLPVDFQDLLSSPSDNLFDCSSPDKQLPISLTNSIWSTESNSECDPNVCMFNNCNYPKETSVPNIGFGCDLTKREDIWDLNATNTFNTENMEVIYKKLNPLTLNDSDENVNKTTKNSAASQDWIDDYDMDPYARQRYNEVLESVPMATTAIRSLTDLNHNTLHSAFIEIIPRSAPGFIGDNLKKGLYSSEKFRIEIPELKKPVKKKLWYEEDDEDLLTSLRTHFRPIKESDDASQTTVSYADGVTFPIVSDLDDVKFKRSSSGTLFLESDAEPPKQYMEYRKEGIDYTRLDICPSADCSDDGLSSTDLILKFRVCQNEKSVQTEEPTLKVGVSPFQMSSPESSIISIEEKSVTLFDTDSELESIQVNWVQCDECKLNANPWNTDQTTWQPGTKYSATKTIWSPDEKFCKACSEQRAEAKAKRRDSQKVLMYREDTAKEWDELLSDITYAQSMPATVGEESEPDDRNTPWEATRIAATEVTIRGGDDFIESTLAYWKQKDGGRDVVGGILKRSLSLYRGGGGERAWGRGEGRKRRHSAGGAGGAGKLRRPLPPAPPSLVPLIAPLLAFADRPLTR